jgi:uncharacterized NAD(P)/FAD-binding protein YdhS
MSKVQWLTRRTANNRLIPSVGGDQGGQGLMGRSTGMTKVSLRRIAIVGFGPRGLGALEALTRAAEAGGTPVAVDIFDPGRWPAAGPNFSPDENEACLLNLPLRTLDLPPPPEGGIESFGAWLGNAGRDGEAYLPRARLGQYLVARFEALMSRLPVHIKVTLNRHRIEKAKHDSAGWTLHAEGEAFGPYHHILLSLGQPETRPDKQLARWQNHADEHGLALCSAYPGADLVTAAEGWAGRVVGIRGLALSALDVVRLLSIGLGGRFENGRYLPSGREPGRIVPFSLDGHAPAPKPANAALDEQFDPRPEEYNAFETALGKILMDGTDDLAPICHTLASATLRVLADSGSDATRDTVDDWLRTERESPGAQERRGTTAALCANIAQAEGTAQPEIGYVIGQVWRKLQPQLRSIYDATPVNAATASALTDFDEGLKRYSYGAPVETARQLLTLIEAGLVEPRAADDPDIRLTPEGWQLHSGDQSLTVDIMIDSVLPSPVLARVEEPLIENLRTSTILQPLGEGLGARCARDASLIAPGGETAPGVHLIGRLANGSAIAADSIHDCFGANNERWARAVIATPLTA